MSNANAKCVRCGEWYDRSSPQCRHSKTHIQNYWDDDGLPHRGRNIQLCSRCTIELELWLLVGADECMPCDAPGDVEPYDTPSLDRPETYYSERD